MAGLNVTSSTSGIRLGDMAAIPVSIAARRLHQQHAGLRDRQRDAKLLDDHQFRDATGAWHTCPFRRDAAGAGIGADHHPRGQITNNQAGLIEGYQIGVAIQAPATRRLRPLDLLKA